MSKASKYALVIILGLILSGSIAAFGYLWRKSRSSNVQYELAQSAIDRQDWLGAKITLRRILARDPTSERAMKMMVAVAKSNDDPPLAAHWLGRLMKLNEFEASYADEYRHTLLRLRDYPRFQAAIALFPESRRKPDDDAWLMLSRFYGESGQKTLKQWERWKRDRPKGEPSDIVRLVDTIYTMDGKTVGENYESLESLAKSKDEDVRLEAVLALGDMQILRHMFDKVEQTYALATNLNYYAATPKLIRWRMMQGRFQDAVLLNGEYLKRFPTHTRAIMQGEMLTAARRTDMLPDILKPFKAHDYSTLALRAYFDALKAYDANDMKALNDALPGFRKSIRTPWALMMAAFADARGDNPERLKLLMDDWLGIRRLPEFFGCREKVHDIVKRVIGEEVEKGTAINEIAPLATALQSSNPNEEDIELTRILIVAGLRAGTFSEDAMRNAVARHPHDPGILQLASEASLKQGDGQTAIAYAEQLEKTGTNLVIAASLKMRGTFLIAADEPSNTQYAEAATQLMRDYYAADTNPPPASYRACWAYAEGTKHPEDLQFLKERSTVFAPFCDVLLLEGSGRKKEALDALEKTKTDIPALIYWSALRLARGERNQAAIERFERLRAADTANEDIGVMVNLSELYVMVGRADDALKFAKNAWEAAPGLAMTQACYARRLAERKEWTRIREITHLPPDAKEADSLLVAAWIPAMEAGIQADWTHGNQFAVRDGCRQLLNYAPDNAVAKEYFEKFEAWRKSQKGGNK